MERLTDTAGSAGFAESLLGFPVSAAALAGFLCGAALLYLVMQRQVKRNQAEGESPAD